LLGFQFDEERMLVIVHTNATTSEESLQHEELNPKDCLAVALHEGILERLSNGWLKFRHDHIHQAALKLVGNDNECATMHLQIGTTLWAKYQLETIESQAKVDDHDLFVCCDQLNLAPQFIGDHAFKTGLARLNSETLTTRAATLSAFVPPTIRYQ
jgi:hypothetical protein